MLKLSQRGAIQFIILIILIAGLVAGLYLVQKTQIFKPKAAPTLPQNPETSFELELELNPGAILISDNFDTGTSVTSYSFTDDPTPTSLSLNSKFRVDIYARADTDPANLFAAKIKYTANTVEFVEINKREGQSFVKNWVEAAVDNSNTSVGVVSMVGGVPSPGIQTDSKVGAYLFSTVIFKAKKTGTAKIEISDSSAIYSNANNINILTARKGNVEVPIQDIQPSPTPTPEPLSCNGITVEGGIQVKNNSGETAYYVVESEGKVKLTANVTPSNAKVVWTGDHSSNLPDQGKFDPNDSPVTTYTAPKNSGNKLEGVTVKANIVDKTPAISCKPVTVAVKSLITPSPIPGNTVNYHLEKNWNSFGLPVTPENSLITPDYFLTNITQGKCDVIIGFNAAEGQAKRYGTDPDKQIYNSLTAIEPGKGYYVNCPAGPIEFQISGQPLTTNPVVIAGWSQISLPFGINKNARTILNELSTPNLSCDIIETMQDGSVTGSKVTFKGSDSGDGFTVQDTKGYYIHCNQKTSTPAPSPSATPVPGTGDGNNDGKVDLIDLSILLSDFNKNGGSRTGIDLKGDGVINTFDFSLMRNLLIQKGVIKG